MLGSKHLKIITLCFSIFLTAVTVPTAQVHANETYTESSDAELSRQAEREVRKAIQNPTEFENGIPSIANPHGLKAMTVDMAKFYWAVAAVEFTHCLTSRDSTQCVQFMEGLKDPIGHIGFALFMKTNHLTIDAAMVVTRGKINPGMASYLGLAAGMMAQSVFQDLYYHRLTQKLFKTNNIRDPELRSAEREKVLNEMWSHFKSNAGSYLFNKIPNVIGLLGAAYVSHKTVQALGHMFTKSSRVVKFVFNKKTATTILKFGRELIRQRRVLKAGFKLAWKGSRLVRVHPVVAIGSYLIETIVFLIWAPIIEETIVKWWDQSNAEIEIGRGKREVEHAARNYYSRSSVETKARKIAKGWDKYRESIMSKAEITKMRHLISIQKVDKEFQSRIMYYEWLVRGMNRESELYQLNELDWHDSHLIGSINEAADYAEGFFCGKTPYAAVERSIDLSGVPVPGSYSFDFSRDMNRTHYENMQINADTYSNPTGISIDHFRVQYLHGTCERHATAVDGGSIDWTGSYEDVWCPIDFHPSNSDDYKIEIKRHKTYKLFCDVNMSQARHHILRTGRWNRRDIRDDMMDNLDEAGGKVMNKVWSQRDLMVMRYEKAIRKELLTGLTGKDASIDEHGDVEYGYFYNRAGIIPGGKIQGFIPNTNLEDEMWDELSRDYPRYRTTFNKFKMENVKKRIQAREIQEYSEMDYSKRVRRQNFFQEVPKEDWEKVVHTLREYIIP